MHPFKIGVGCGVANGLSQKVLEAALDAGIRDFDTSTFYAPGALVHLEQTLQRKGIARGDVRLSVKLWMTDFGANRETDYDLGRVSLYPKFEEIRAKLNCRQIDSLVIHWPLKVDGQGIPEEFQIAEIWPRLEKLVDVGLVREIGVSNFNIVELHRLLEVARIRPASNQVEFNPLAHSADMLAFCQANNIRLVGHSPFGFGWTNGHLKLFENETIRAFADELETTPACLVLAWAMTKGVMPIPGTTKAAHVADFAAAVTLAPLPDAMVAAIDALNARDFHYLDMLRYFGSLFQKRYFSDSDIHVQTMGEDGRIERVSILDPQFLAKAKESLTLGGGVLVIPEILADQCQRLKRNLTGKLSSADRWNGKYADLSSIINAGPEVLEMLDDPIVSLIVESLLGWDCKLDNISLSTSRPAPHNKIFGPHQDSPFDNNIGAPLPPPTYPMVFQVIVAVDEFKDDNGPLYVIPGSHKKRQRVTLPWQGGLRAGMIPEGALKIIAPQGSVIIAVGHIWHGAYANETDTPRHGLLMEYVSSFCDARDKFTASLVTEDLLRNCSPRVVRLLGRGKTHQHGVPTIANAYKALRVDAVPGYAVRA